MFIQILFNDDKGTCMNSTNTNKLNLEICIFALLKVNIYLQLYIYICFRSYKRRINRCKNIYQGDKGINRKFNRECNKYRQSQYGKI